MQAVLPYEDARRLDTFALHVWPASATPVTSMLYEDAGDGYAHERGSYRLTTFTTSAGTANGSVDVALARTGSYPGARAFTVTVHALPRAGSVQADGRSVPVRYDAARRTASFTVASGVRRITVTP
jgi:hypothetical protein